MPSNSDKEIQRIYNTFGTADFQSAYQAQDWITRDEVGYAAVSAFNFFAIPSGQNDPNLGVRKTKEQTNLLNPNQIGGQEFLVIQKIRMKINNSAKVRQLGTGISTYDSFAAQQLQMAQLISAITQQGVFTLSVNKRTIITMNVPFQAFGAGFGLGEVFPPSVGYTDGTPAAINGGANAYVANSQYDMDGTNGDSYRVQPIIVFAPSTSFEVAVSFPNNTNLAPSPANIYGASTNQTATMWLFCGLEGQLVRPRS